MFVLGFDIGGTKCAVVLAKVKEENVEFLEREQVSSVPDWKGVLNRLAARGEAMMMKHGVSRSDCRIGISCGGPLSADRMLILSPPNLLGWDQVPVVEFLSEKLRMPAKMENDADACALAEWKYGAGKGSRNMIFLTFGTGLGAGLILDGKLYKGTSGAAGETGHIRLAKDGPEGYGKAGSFEGFCSGGGIRKLAISYAEEKKALGKLVGYVKWNEKETKGDSVKNLSGIEDGEKDLFKDVTAKSVAMAAKAGDPDAIEVFRISGRYFGQGLSILMDLLNPEVIVVGSIFARSGELLEEAMYEEIKKEALPQTAAVCEIRPAMLGEQIGDYGSVMAAL